MLEYIVYYRTRENKNSIKIHQKSQTFSFPDVTSYSNITFFFRFGNKRASYPFGIISLPYAPVNVTDFSNGSINCNTNNADRGRSIMRVT